MKRNIAILGAGFAGLGLAATLLEKKRDVHITLFDPKGIGGGASGISAGLLHPFTGARSKLNWKGHQAMRATQHLLTLASCALQSQVYIPSGIFRPALDPEQMKDFQHAASSYPEIRYEKRGLHEGIWIENGITVYSKRYLEGLFAFCLSQGMTFLSHEAKNLDSFDKILSCRGAAEPNIPLTRVKGQILQLAWPKNIPPLPYPLNSKAYLVMHPDGTSCLAGATYEREFTTEEPDTETARRLLLPKILPLVPQLENAKVLFCEAGIRAFLPGHLPKIFHPDEKNWIITGFGSKGLLYHALFAEDLVCHLSI